MMKQDQLATPLKLTTLYNRFLWTFLITGLVLVTVQDNVERTLDLTEYRVPNLRRARDLLFYIDSLSIIFCYGWISYVVYKVKFSPYWMTSACVSLVAVCGLMEVNSVLEELPATSIMDGIAGNSTQDTPSKCNSTLVFDSQSPTQPYSLPEVLWDSSLVTVVVVRALLSFGTAVYCLMGLVVIDNTADGTLTPLVLAMLLIIQTSFPSFVPLISSLVSIATSFTTVVDRSSWIGVWDRGWIPLGLGSLCLAFLYPYCSVPVRSCYSLVSFASKRHQQITSLTSQHQQNPVGSAKRDIQINVELVEKKMRKESESESKKIETEDVTDREERGDIHANRDLHVNVRHDLDANDTIGVNNSDIQYSGDNIGVNNGDIQPIDDNIVGVDANSDGESDTDDAQFTSKDIFKSLTKLLRNRIFLFNTLSDLFIVAALLGIDQIQAKLTPNLNFPGGFIVENEDTGGPRLGDELGEGSTLRTWFQYSGYLNAIGQSVTLLITGCIVAKVHPNARKLTTWKIMSLLFMLSFVVMFMRDFNQSGGQNRNFKFNLQSSPATCKAIKLLTAPLQQMPVSSQLQQNNDSLQLLLQQQLSFAFPVCSDKDRMIFASPCEAGCQQICAGPNRTQFFSNCSSLSDGTVALSSNLCPKSTLTQMVWILYIFIVIKCLLITTRVISIFLTIRCVPKQDRVLGLSVILGLATLLTIWDQDNFAVKHIIELALLSLISTSLVWYLLKSLPLYIAIKSCTFPGPTIIPNNPGGKSHKASYSRKREVNASPREHITMLPRDSSIDEMAILDVRMMSKQRDSIDVTKFKMNRLKAVGKRFSIDYKKRSLQRCEEHVVYP
uniref:Transmembrane protein n=1 Tax=Cacopsylla melanoneura TaxID=428564 RepID=A0A8D9E2M3_9HEMI